MQAFRDRRASPVLPVRKVRRAILVRRVPLAPSAQPVPSVPRAPSVHKD